MGNYNHVGGGGRHNASIFSANGAAYGLGGLITIMAVGPAHTILSEPFVTYIAEYYGASMIAPAGVFLFLLMTGLIFMIATASAHTLIEALRAKTHFYLTRIKRSF